MYIIIINNHNHNNNNNNTQNIPQDHTFTMDPRISNNVTKSHNGRTIQFVYILY